MTPTQAVFLLDGAREIQRQSTRERNNGLVSKAYK